MPRAWTTKTPATDQRLRASIATPETRPTLTMNQRVHVHIKLLFLLGILFLLIGCGTSARDSQTFPLVDRDATKQAFIDTVREYYQTRSRRGALSDPFIEGDRIKFIFRYKKILFGKYAEHVQLDFYPEQPAATTGTAAIPAHYLVGAWYPKQGSDTEAPEVRTKIVDGMNKRLGPAPAAK